MPQTVEEAKQRMVLIGREILSSGLCDATQVHAMGFVMGCILVREGRLTPSPQQLAKAYAEARQRLIEATPENGSPATFCAGMIKAAFQSLEGPKWPT